ncbi:MAG: hypothetical protein KDD35_07860, partial [Bdellovibrionales bacterium]|nr:hypothetical protein [Bdellovibrionales bacterium]
VDVQGYQLKCQKGEIFTPPSGSPLTQEDLLRSVWGKYELDQVHVHHKATTPDGKYIGAFYAIATRYLGNSTYMGANKIREIDLKYDCDEYNKDSGVPFITGVNVPVAAVMHSPSGRITVFDQGGQMDNPQFNLPLLSEVHFDSTGSAHYKHAVGISEPPYVSDRYLSDVIRRYSVEPKLYIRSNGDFEMRVSWSEQKDLGEGRSFKTETDVVITYKGYE